MAVPKREPVLADYKIITTFTGVKQIFLFLTVLLFPVTATAQIREEYRPLADMLATLPEREPTEGNLVELLSEGPYVFEKLQEDILAAEETIHAEYFIFNADYEGNTIRTAMRLKALDGLEVRYIAEDFSTNGAFIDNMKKSGVEVKHHALTPLRCRNHQKLLLLDRKVGYTGGLNIAHDNFYDWEDITVRLRGPIVAKMEQLYAKMWERHLGKPSAYDIPEIQPYEGGVIAQSVDDNPETKAHLNLKAYIWALEHAKDYFFAKTPYFKPPQELADALADAARRGVDVRLIIPWEKDPVAVIEVPFERVFYEDLVKAGVHIYMRTDMFDHSKMFVMDDYLSCTGSINLDALSLLYNFENNVYFYDEGTALQIKSIIEDDFDKCFQLTMEHINAFPFWQKRFKNALRILGKVF